jgi:hypothetical protein
MGEHRSVLVLFLEAAIKTAPLRWPNWHAGPLEVDGFGSVALVDSGACRAGCSF